MGRLVAMGAEASIYEDSFFGLEVIRKIRLPKRYRARELDEEIRHSRTHKEARALAKAKSHGIPCPCILDLHGAEIVLEKIRGNTLREALSLLNGEVLVRVARRLGEIVGKLHSAGLVHNDLTGVNFLLPSGPKDVCLIDFGLVDFSIQNEDRAVDLHVLKQSILASNPDRAAVFFNKVLEGYRMALGSGAGPVISRLEQVERRGRYRR